MIDTMELLRFAFNGPLLIGAIVIVGLGIVALLALWYANKK